ncbi:methyltransferase family protein [Sphingomonas sp.]|uniref:methyltransferase family protein n=1 Tax=Sphingomonas sp. TaxID=28214 RepID=UPI0035BC357B
MTAVGLPGLAALATGYFAWLVALVFARRRRDRAGEANARGSRRSMLGIALQSAGFLAVGLGPVRVALDPLGARALAEALSIAAAMAAAVMLFVTATRAMGRNWSLVARTRDDHSLVTAGPFAYVRHPIYVAMALTLPALAIALGHAAGLLIGIFPFALGTWLRVDEEERLLRAAFGSAYDAYARRVKRFVPGLV